jgi:tRNA(Ile)-lysidine synthase
LAINLAHTRDYKAETDLLPHLRGAGSAGLGAMRARSGRLLRPMLDASRADVLDHLSEHGLAWREDPSNADPAFLRNRVRHELIPYLEARFNPAIREALARTASVLAAEADVLAAQADAIAVRTAGQATELDRAAVLAAPRAVARLAVRNAIRGAGGLRAVALDHVDAIVDLAAKRGTSGRRLPLPGGREAAIHFDVIRITGVAAKAAPPPEGPLVVPGLPAGTLTVRTRRPGDRVRSAGREVSLKRFLADRRVPAADRDRLSVVAAGRNVVWVEGLPVDGMPGVTFDDVQIGRPALTMRKTVRPKALMGRKPGRAAK